MPGFFKVVGLLFAALLVVFFLGPRPDTSQTVSFEPDSLGADLDAYLAEGEARFSDLRDGVSKEIIWNNPVAKNATEYALVYVHGFSATKMETAPVSQQVAQALNANLFLTRLAGHGRGGTALAEIKLTDWLNDMAEAIAIGQRLGNKVVLLTGSTGGTLATWAAAQPQLADAISGIVLISPNYAIQGASTGLINMPWAEAILPAILGAERSFEPINEGHRAGWTHQYPSRAVFPMAALLRIVESINKSAINIPALFIYSQKDSVVIPGVTREVAENWGGQTSVLMIEDSQDPNNHVIAGDILSPNTTERVSSAIIEWISTL